MAEIAIAPKADARSTIAVAYTKLASPDHVAQWKAFWTDWLAALDEQRV